MLEISELNLLLDKIGTISDPVAKGIVTEVQKVELVTDLVELLQKDDIHDEKILETLRVLCREPLGSQVFFQPCVIEILINRSRISTHDIVQLSTPVAIDCLKCLANIQSMDPASRNLIAKSSIISDLVPTLKALHKGKSETGPLFLILRIIFFVTAVDEQTVEIVTKQELHDTLALVLSDVRKDHFQVSPWVQKDLMLRDILKIAFNITLDQNSLATSFFSKSTTLLEVDLEGTKHYRNLLAEILSVFLGTELNSPAMSASHSSAINALVNFPFDPLVDIWFPNGELTLVHVLIDILKDSLYLVVPENNDDKIEDNMFGYPIDQCLLMLLMLLKKLSIEEKAKQFIKEQMMPANIDRSKPLTIGPSFTAGLVRVMNSIHLSQTRDFLCDLMVTLCDGNSRYFGYGNTAGYMFTNRLFGGNVPSKADTQNESIIGDDIDPITGYKKEEKPDPWAGMSDDDKEREAERLFVLFDRLQKNGIIKMVPNQNS